MLAKLVKDKQGKWIQNIYDICEYLKTTKKSIYYEKIYMDYNLNSGCCFNFSKIPSLTE